MAKCKITICFLFLLLFATFVNTLSAEEIAVHPGEGIQDAINQAVSGDTVFVYAGTYIEDVTMKDGVDLEGESCTRAIIKGHVFFQDANCTLKDITVLFPESSLLSYSNDCYPDWKLAADTGITAINSQPTIQNCVIKPDLVLIDPTGTLAYYGKAIQIWNLYSNPETAPRIENTLIRDTDCGIYYFSQTFGGVISGNIKNNTFYHNKIGVLLRMHKENPHIYNNIFDNCQETGIFLAYEDGGLLTERKANINNNLFNQNTQNLWIDSSGTSYDIINIQGNIQDDPLFVDPGNENFYLQPGSPALTGGEDGSLMGVYGEATCELFIEITLPADGETIYAEP